MFRSSSPSLSPPPTHTRLSLSLSPLSSLSPFPDSHRDCSRIFVAGFGAAFGTTKTAMGICHAVVEHPRRASIMKSLIPVAMAGVRGIYGLVGAVVIISTSTSRTFLPVKILIELKSI